MTKPPSFDSPMSSIASVTAGLIHTITAKSDGADPVKFHPGRSIDILRNGMPRYEARIAELGLGFPLPAAARESVVAEYERGQRLCESPIERNMLAALLTGSWPICTTGHPRVHNAKDYAEPFPKCEVVIVPQMAIFRFRLDLGLVVATAQEARPLLVGIECDGKEFHEDRQKDAARDAYLQAIGLRIVRATGSILHREPIAAADEIIKMVMGWRK